MLAHFKNRLYIVIAVSFGLLFFSLFVSSKSISQTSKMIDYIENKQLQLLRLAQNINTDALTNQSEIFKAILLHDDAAIKRIINSSKKLSNEVALLDKFMQENQIAMQDIKSSLEILKRRIIGYKAVQDSLVEALKEAQKEDIEDAIIGFNATNAQLSHDLSHLIEQLNSYLNTNITELKKSNENSRIDIFYSFIIALGLILFSVRKLSILHAEAAKDLQRAEKAEAEQKLLQEQLLRYNDELEKEITKKSNELREKIFTHFLSGLPNRNQLLEDTHHYAFKQMALLNIDKFQKFNDVYGEEVGNLAIKMSADFLKEQLDDDENSLLYHIGGDEFAIVVKKSFGLYDTKFVEFIEAILRSYKNHKFEYDGKTFHFMMSAGIAFSGRKKMLAYADMALKDAKNKNIEISVFSDDRELEKTHQDDIDCHKKLLYALEHKRLLCYFQPITPLQDTTKMTKFEALARLLDQEGNTIAPYNFLRVAKSNRIYHKVTKRILENTLQTITAHEIPCSLNISMEDIASARTLKMLYSALDTFSFNHLLTIELLETEEITNYESVYSFCMKIRSYGAKIALDDFGSGYSNFSHILKLPIDYIKIDSSLISNIDRDQNSQIMVETIVGLAKKLHIETIAEFVSSQSIYEIVQELGVDYAQGFYVGRPEPIERHLTPPHANS